MLDISLDDISKRLQLDNPWWGTPYVQGEPTSSTENSALFSSKETNIKIHYEQERAFFYPFAKLALDWSIKRSIILMGPRRVGKTVMLQQLTKHAIENGFLPERIMFASLDTPLYAGISLDKFLEIFEKCTESKASVKRIVIFDEIQYLKNWEQHLKVLADRHPNTRFIASGSAAAELKRKSQESGAGRFTDIFLPPLTFAEFLAFRKEEDALIKTTADSYETRDINRLNAEFIDYLNFGGYPEAVMGRAIRSNPNRFLGSDIIDKAVFHDLPKIYGVQDVQELYRFFITLAYNAGQEIKPGSLKNMGISINTINKYMEYLEAAFLIARVRRADDTGKTFKRTGGFKPYLINPCMRAALFRPLKDGDDHIGPMVETAIFSQCFPANIRQNVFYARWKKGRSYLEVDMVHLDHARKKITLACEIKWSDRYTTKNSSNLPGLIALKQRNPNLQLIATSKSVTSTTQGKASINHIPAALYCYKLGKDLIKNLI